MNINCDMAMDLVSLYNDGSASDSSVKAVEQHLKECPDCRKFYKQYRIVTGRASSFDAAAVSDEQLSYNKIAVKLRRRRLMITAAMALYSGIIAGILTFILLRQRRH